MNLIELALKSNLIQFNEDRSTITYIHQKINRNYNNPEEKVQAEAFCKLVFEYNYPQENIKQFVKVTVGADIREADIIVYNDSTLLK